MDPIIEKEHPLPGVESIGIFLGVMTEPDEIHFPIIVDGKKYHIKMNDEGVWCADGLSDEVCSYIGSLIHQYENEKNES